MNTFEENLAKLEKLTSDIKRSDISLEDALKDFEEGIKLASGMEKQLDEIEGKIQILMNEPQPVSKDNPPQLDLFSDDSEVNGTRR
ncbi:exodeoxyribonuclease VII small subunit [Treponema bryantii]|jgi:exodeoxyribonuclease VII small subunit|uniref:exodeoxyribonuclease VII small subunit n=1 Tax=Treponema bryantii TaxID=163 RepID=UPI002B3092E0|nr:exodeoxyribonuclease 7 small subunit [Treponema bryantii]